DALPIHQSAAARPACIPGPCRNLLWKKSRRWKVMRAGISAMFVSSAVGGPGEAGRILFAGREAIVPAQYTKKTCPPPGEMQSGQTSRAGCLRPTDRANVDENHP